MLVSIRICCYNGNMTSQLLIHEKRQISDGLIKELKVWRVDPPVLGSAHPFKYRLVLIAHGQCVLRYDNERGKGDHRHPYGDHRETAVSFVDLAALLDAFHRDIQDWRETHGYTADSR